MSDPFLLDGPTCISFSGGRTSAYMLWRILQANHGLPSDVMVCFANTGKEMEATLRFVHECASRWRVAVHWVEYRNDARGFTLVNVETARQSSSSDCRRDHHRTLSLLQATMGALLPPTLRDQRCRSCFAAPKLGAHGQP